MNAFKKFVGDGDGGGSSSGGGIAGMVGLGGSGGGESSSSGGIAGMVGRVTGQAPAEEDPFSAACSLSKKQRMIGFASCFALGMLISFLSMMRIANPTSFALLYSLGNIVSFLSTGFLVGPKRQLKSACARKRAIATFLFLGSIVGTLCVALILKSVLLCILFIIIQFCALVWYTASYIPFAQQALVSAIRGCFRR